MNDKKEYEVVREALNRSGDGGGAGNQTVAAISLSGSLVQSGEQTIDGYSAVEGDLILDAFDSAGGIWTVKKGDWKRAANLRTGMMVTIRNGRRFGGTLWFNSGTNSAPSFTWVANCVAVNAIGMSVSHSGIHVVDGVTLSAGDLVFDAPNVYAVQSGAWALVLAYPDMVTVGQGTANGPLVYTLASSGSYVVCGAVYL